MTPYALVSAATDVRRETKRELIRLSRQRERAAREHAPPAVGYRRPVHTQRFAYGSRTPVADAPA